VALTTAIKAEQAEFALDSTYPLNGYPLELSLLDMTDMEAPDQWQNFRKNNAFSGSLRQQTGGSIFFFGNSFTERNTLALRVRYIYAQAADISGNIRTPRRSPGGATLGTHFLWLNGEDNPPTFDSYDWLVIQDQSAVPAVPHWRFSSNYYWTRLLGFFSPDVPIMLWQTWGYRHGFKQEGQDFTYLEMTDALMTGYLEYIQTARTNGYDKTYLAPVGNVWATVYKDCVAAGIEPRSEDCLWSEFYENDGSHPAGPGTYATGMTIAVSMTGLSPYKVSYNQLDDQMTGNRLKHEIIRDAVSRTIRETFKSGLIDYPFDDLWEYEEYDWEPITAPPLPPTPAPTFAINIMTRPPTARPTEKPTEKPTDKPTNAPTTPKPTDGSPTPKPSFEPTTLSPTLPPSARPSEMLAFNAIFMGTRNYLANGDLAKIFTMAFEESLPVEERGPVMVGLNPIDRWDNTPLSLPAGFNKVTVDWLVLQEHTDFASVPNDHNESIASVAGGIDIHKGLGRGLGAQTMFLMSFGAMDGYTVNVTVNGTSSNVTFDNFTSHTSALWEGYKQYVNKTSQDPSNPTYLAPAGLVVETIYMDILNNGTDPLAEGTLFRKLYKEDGISPTLHGFYLIALTLTASISGADPTNLTKVTEKSWMDPEDALHIQHAVSRTILKTKADGLVYPWYEAWPTMAPTAPPTDDATSNTLVAFSKTSNDVPSKEVHPTSNITDEDHSAKEESGEEYQSQGISPDMEEVLGFSSGSRRWLLPGMFLLGQAAIAWIV
jgi:hypothetical protein